MESAFYWALVATLIAGVQSFTQKVVAHERRDSALSGVFGYGVSGIFAVIVASFYPLPAEWFAVALISVIAGLVHAYGSYVRIESLKNIDAVLYFPINKVLGPLLVVAIGVVWFREYLTLLQYVGIALSITVPLLLVSSVEHHRQRNLRLGLILLVVSTVLTALTSPFQKVALNIGTNIFFMMAISQFAGTIASAILYARTERSNHAFDLHPRDIKLGLMNGVLQFFSFSAFLTALSLGTVSILYVIHAHYILVPIILSVWWYREHVNLRKLAAIVVSSFAIILLGI